MATIEDRNLIHTLLINDGYFPGDPQVSRIYRYHNIMVDRILYAIFLSEEHDDIAFSPAVGAYDLLWSRDDGLTIAGVIFLAEE